MKPQQPSPATPLLIAAPARERRFPIEFDFDTPVDRRASASVKWDRYKGRDVIPLWVADMDFRSPPAVIAALHERIDHGVFGYTRPPSELSDTVIATLRADYNWEVLPEWVVWLPGLVVGLNVSCRATGSPGDQVVTTVPVYPPFLSAPAHGDRTLVTIPLFPQRGRHLLDIENIVRSFGAHTSLFLFCNPHNPTGRVFSREEVLALLNACRAYHVTVCSDEIHCGLILDADKRHVPLASLDPDLAAQTITLMAPSKTFNVPGLGCSFAIIPDPTVRKRFIAAKEGIVPDVNLFGYTAALAAYRHGELWLEALIDYLRKNRDLVEQRIAAMPGLSTFHVEGTYLAWIDARATAIPDPGKFFEAAGVGLSDGRHFGAPGFLRLNFACARILLEEALDRMERALAERS
jgi:cystathionine beta-lyase